MLIDYRIFKLTLTMDVDYELRVTVGGNLSGVQHAISSHCACMQLHHATRAYLLCLSYIDVYQAITCKL